MSTVVYIRTMLEEAKSLGRDLPVSVKALECYDEASRNGLGAADAVMMTASFVANTTTTPSK